MTRLALALLAALLLAAPAAAQETGAVRIGSKNFTEQEILGELAAQLIERSTGLRVERTFGLGGTNVCHAALSEGAIDLYVEYTGTGLLSILKLPLIADGDEAYGTVRREYLDRFGLEWLPPIGFNNTYAMSVREDDAAAGGWTRLSDLAPVAGELTAGFPSEFMERPDGYPGLQRVYGLTFGDTRDMDIGLMYQALDQGLVDLICAFATDGRLNEYDLRVLTDDRGFFPPYDAAPVVRSDTLERYPELRAALAPLDGAISDGAMRRLNFLADVRKRSSAEIASAWIAENLDGDDGAIARLEAAAESARPSLVGLFIERRGEVAEKAAEHLVLTGLGAGLAILFGVPLGVLVHRRAETRGVVLAFTEIVQTVPSLAMLAFLFAVYGALGAAPAVTALFLYALLPIVLNTYTGLREIAPGVLQAADGVGMSGRQRLIRVELPLAAPVIVAGVRAATVWTVGIATLSTYIGAGGLGDFINRGLARNDTSLVLLGAIPAALMAVALSLLIRLVERSLRRG